MNNSAGDTMTNDYETIIIGAGGTGSAAAYQLARQGRSVLLLEQFEVGHTRGSSHGESRIIRLSYDAPTYVQLAQATYRLWAAASDDLGQPLITPTGGLDLSAPHNPVFEACVAALAQLNIPHEVLDATDLRRRFPQYHIAADTIGLYQADAGMLNPGQCVTALTARAIQYGAHVQDHTAARLIRVHDRGVEVTTDTATYRGRKLIISAGAWTKPLLQSLGVDLPLIVTQEQYAFFEVQPADRFQPDQFPIFIHYGQPSGAERIDYYGFPVFGRAGLKVGEHHAGPAVTADTRSFEVDPVRLQRLTDYVRATFPAASGEVLHAVTCLYTNTPDQHFIIDTLPGRPHVIVASPCSGHGFKFSILIGQILADLAVRGETAYPIEM
ncbi:MAG TPA: N-methyl-L-tryptophan oxidase, partial [Anaerolineae bacterium]|nr:N-methyl-L-tryptophan oxidase [Anaerolineae bacterium]